MKNEAKTILHLCKRLKRNSHWTWQTDRQRPAAGGILLPPAEAAAAAAIDWRPPWWTRLQYAETIIIESQPATLHAVNYALKQRRAGVVMTTRTPIKSA